MAASAWVGRSDGDVAGPATVALEEGVRVVESGPVLEQEPGVVGPG